MAIATDILIDYVNKRIYQDHAYVEATDTEYTAQELYTYIQDTFDELAQMDDTMPMSAQTPNAFTMINGWFVDDETIKWFKGGAIESSGWLHPTNITGIRLLKLVDVREPTSSTYAADAGTGVTTIVDTQLTSAVNDFYNGYIVFNTTRSLSGKVTDYVGATKTITCESITGQTTGDTYYLLASVSQLVAADIGTATTGGTTGDTGKLLAYNATRKTLWIRCDAADDLFDNASEKITVNTENCGNMTAVSSTGENLYVNLYTLGTLTSASDTIYIIQADEKITAWWGTGINKCDVLIKVKELGATIDSGNVIVFCRYYPTAGNAALYDHFPITLTTGRQAVPLATALDLNNTTAQATVSAYGVTYATAGPYSRNLNNGYGATNYDVEITCNGKRLSEVYEHCKYVSREGSTTQLFSDNGEEYIYANATYAPVKTSPLGTFAGGKFFGARGIWITGYHTDDVKNFQLISSNGVIQNPPNTVVCKISSIAVGDRCGMFMLPSAGAEIQEDTYTLDGDHSALIGTITVVENIVNGWAGQDPPQAGYMRIIKPNNSEILKTYTSWSGKEFLLTGTLGSLCGSASDVWIPIIDAQAASTFIQNTLIQENTIYVTVRVRKKGIIPFEAPRSIGATGLDVPAVRTTDGIVL